MRISTPYGPVNIFKTISQGAPRASGLYCWAMRKFGGDSANKRARKALHNITTAQKGLSDDLPRRQRRYFISMMIRTACFLLAVILPSPYRWIALAGSLIIPYVAVVMANAGRETISPGTSLINDKNKSIN